MTQHKHTFLLIGIAYIFSVLVRLIWVYQFQGNASFFWNEQFMINTNDGYYFAESAKNMLSGTSQWELSINGAVAMVTAFFVKILPFDFETIILYMPTFLGSLLVIPMVLIGNTLKQPYMGFIAGLFSAIVWSYYNRTMTGYYDSDMLNIVTPAFVLWGILHALTTQKNRYLVLMVFLMVLSQWWYPKNIALNTAMVFMSVVYIFWKDRKNIFNLKLIIFSLIGLSLIPVGLKVLISLAFFLVFHYQDKLVRKYIYIFLGLISILYIFSGSFNGIYSSLNLYLIQRFFPSEFLDEIVQLHFYGVINTVREAGAIPFATFANRISGHTITFLVSTIGIILMMIRYPILIISLPLVAMGFMAYKSGLRFTVYAVPVYALGFSYMIMYSVQLLEVILQNTQQLRIKKVGLVILLVSLGLYPNIQHIISYKVPTVLNNIEVNDLEKLKKIASRDDYTLSWWDYGYPIRYYSGTKTIIDGGKHQNDNFIISKIMQTSSPQLVANLSRLAVETYVDSNYSVIANTLFKNGKKDQLDPELFLAELDTSEYKLPKKTRNIYLYLPYRMLNIFPTVTIFGNLDLTTGKAERKITFYPTSVIQKSKGNLKFRNGIVFDATKGIVTLVKQKVDVKYFIVTQNTQNGTINLQSQLYHADGKFVVVYLKSYNRFIVMDTETFKSTYVQMFMLGKYDKNLFELVVSSPYSRIYKLKM